MTTHSPFPWSAKKTTYGTVNFLDANGIKFGNVFSGPETGRNGQDTSARNAEMITALPGLLMAAMRGHGWGDPLHQQAHPGCTMCKAIRAAVGPLTRARVLELAMQDPECVSEMIFEDRWSDVWIYLGIADKGMDEATQKLMDAGEYEALDAELIETLPNA